MSWEIDHAEIKRIRKEGDQLWPHGWEIGDRLSYLEGYIERLEALNAELLEVLESSLLALEISGTDEAEMARLEVYKVIAKAKGEK